MLSTFIRLRMVNESCIAASRDLGRSQSSTEPTSLRVLFNRGLDWNRSRFICWFPAKAPAGTRSLDLPVADGFPAVRESSFPTCGRTSSVPASIRERYSVLSCPRNCPTPFEVSEEVCDRGGPRMIKVSLWTRIHSRASRTFWPSQEATVGLHSISLFKMMTARSSPSNV
jgi:hypothetical protein